MIGLPNPLATSVGRKIAFFMLYFTEGLPQGFTITAIVGVMSRQGMDEKTVGSFAAYMSLPWAFKWIVAPFVDLIYSSFLGRRRGWILGTQVLMAVGFLAAVGVDFRSNLGLFTLIMSIVNAFAATQDVAIDALACEVLEEKERGQVNGLMFAGAYVGTGVGGAGALYLMSSARLFGLPSLAVSIVAVAAAVMAVTLFIVLPMREPAGNAPADKRSFRAAGAYLVEYVTEAGKSFFASRTALAALLFALLPTGAYALGMAISTKLATNIGFDEERLGHMALVTMVTGGLSCVLGGFLADKFGKRKMIAIFAFWTILPNLLLVWAMLNTGADYRLAPKAAGYVAPTAGFIALFWGINIAFSVAQGMVWGSRPAMFMDIVNPRIAATQFTAYMAVQNLVLSYSQKWTSYAVTQKGYAVTYGIDAVFGLCCLPLLLFILPIRKGAAPAPSLPPLPLAAEEQPSAGPAIGPKDGQ